MSSTIRYIGLVALPIVGSATLFISCDQQRSTPKSQEEIEATLTQQADTLRIINTENGKLSYIFKAPLMERYELAKEPYMEFRKGVEVETYNDTTGTVASTLTANYAILLENQKLWEGKGNVICVNERGQKLETEQLYWNQRTKKIYSNVDSKVTQIGGDVVVGIGFESDERFMEWEFRKPKGTVAVDVKPTDGVDSTATTTATPTISPVPPITPSPAATESQQSEQRLQIEQQELPKPMKYKPPRDRPNRRPPHPVETK